MDAMVELVALRDRSIKYDDKKYDQRVDAGELSFDADTRMRVPSDNGFGNIAPFDMTDHAKRQLYAKLGPAVFGKAGKVLPFDYLEALLPPLRSTLLNYHCAASAGRDWLIRTFSDAGANTARAVLHGKYPCIPNTSLLDAVIESIGGNVPPGMKLARPYLDQDRVILRVMWQDTGRPDGNGGSYGIGTYIANDEIGSGRVKVWPLVQRTSCQNSIIFRPLKSAQGFGAGDESPYNEEEDTRGDFIGLSLVHRGDNSRLAFLVKEAIGQSFGAGAEYVKKMIEAETRRLPNFTDILENLAKTNKWTEDVKTAVAIGTEGKETLAGLINGITWAAKGLENPVDQADMETYAGAVLVSADSLFGRAARQREYVTVR